MKVLIVVPRYAPDIEINGTPYFLPLGLMYVSSYLKSKDFEVQNLNRNHYPENKLDEVLQDPEIDTVCTGGVFTELPVIMDVIERTRKLRPDIKIILGGAMASADPEFALESLEPDFLVLGEGEQSIANLVTAIRNDDSFRDVKGIAYMKNGTMVRTVPQELIADLNTHPWPDYAGFEYGHYLDNHGETYEELETIIDAKNKREAFIITSRNCVAKCTFCYRLMTGGHRIRTIEETMSEIKHLIDTYQVNSINLIDEMFAANKQRIYDFCEGVKPLNISWQCQLRCGVIDPDVLKTMKEAGCYYISYGIESASKSVLKSMKKGLHPKQIEDVLNWTIEAGMTIQGNYIFGDPAETLETMQETLDFARKFPSLNLGMIMILPYPGTVLYNKLKSEGKFEDLMAFYLNPSSVFSGRPLNMTSLPEEEFEYMCKKVWNEARASVTHGKIIKSKKLDNINAIVDFKCSTCSEPHHDVHIAFKTDTAVRYCRKCAQRTWLKRCDVYFELFPVLREAYHKYFIAPLLTNFKVYHMFGAKLIDFSRGNGKVGLFVKRLLGMEKHKTVATRIDQPGNLLNVDQLKKEDAQDLKEELELESVK